MMEKPVAVDFFCGAGGLSLGLEQAGFDVACGVEYDPVHAAVHAFNFPECNMVVDDVSNLSGRDIRERTRIGDRHIHLVSGGPPCQGFSIIGKRALDDPRNRLALDYVRLVGELRPDYFVFENVRGLAFRQYVGLLHEIVRGFDEVGYSVVLPWSILNARDFGVPQHRERLIMLGHRKGLEPMSYPAPTGVGFTCADALSDLPDVEGFEALRGGDSVPFRHPKRAALGAYARSMRPRGNVGWHDGDRRLWDDAMLTSSARTDHGPESRARFAATEEGQCEAVSHFFKLPRDGVCHTLRAGTDAGRGAFTSPRPIHYDYARCVSVREMARLHGFPDWFRFHVTKAHGAREIGNAVPPPLARAVGAEIRKLLPANDTIVGTLALGDPALLSMDMGAASAHWGVRSPIGVRNRKPASRKHQRVADAARPPIEVWPSTR